MGRIQSAAGVWQADESLAVHANRTQPDSQSGGFGNCSQIDDQITRELLGSLEEPPRWKLVSSGVPTLSPLPIGPDSDIRS